MGSRKRSAEEQARREKILSMYAKGITTSDIEAHILDIYGLEVSDTIVNQITDKILPLAKGRKDLLRIWVGENESAKYWATVLNGLRNCGVAVDEPAAGLEWRLSRCATPLDSYFLLRDSFLCQFLPRLYIR